MSNILYTKSILKPKEISDGIRISVMSRHTLNDGKTPDERILPFITFDEWVKDFSPPLKLIGSYYRKEIDWEYFKNKYIEFLTQGETDFSLQIFAKRCSREVITIMCIEESPEFCHRKILAEAIKNYNKLIIILHK